MPDPIANPPDFNWVVLLPQLIVLALALVTLLYDVIVPDGQERNWFMTAMSVVGYGGAEKEQVEKMVRLLLPGCATLELKPDAADALAVAICHAHTAGSRVRTAQLAIARP